MDNLSKNQILVINLFRKNPFISKTIREISIILKKAYPRVYEALKNLEKNGVIKIKKAGNSNLCELNLSYKSIPILAFLENQEAFSQNMPSINKILEFGEFLDDIIIVTGSYAKNTQKRKSDLDLAVITKDDAFKKQKLLENLTLTFLPKVHPICFSKNDFIQMLLSKEENFGKEVFKNHLIFRNAEGYYNLLKKATENGFRN